MEQVVDGLRQCILSGFYKAGDILPTTRDLAEMLGVSRIVTRAAVRELTKADRKRIIEDFRRLYDSFSRTMPWPLYLASEWLRWLLKRGI